MSSTSLMLHWRMRIKGSSAKKLDDSWPAYDASGVAEPIAFAAFGAAGGRLGIGDDVPAAPSCPRSGRPGKNAALQRRRYFARFPAARVHAMDEFFRKKAMSDELLKKMAQLDEAEKLLSCASMRGIASDFRTQMDLNKLLLEGARTCLAAPEGDGKD